MIKESEAHEERTHWTLMKNSEVINKQKKNMGRLRLFDPFGISSTRYYQTGD